MHQKSELGPDRDAMVVEPTEQKDRKSSAEEWLLELQREEGCLAPWLALERIGEEVKIRRG